MSTRSKHIVISEKNQLMGLYTGSTLRELRTCHSDYQVGDIYLGKLENVMSNINAAFVKLDLTKQNGFIQSTNLVPKEVRNGSSVNWIKYNFGRQVLVQIIKEPNSDKGPSLTTNISLMGKYLLILPFEEGVKTSKRMPKSPKKDYIRAFFTVLKPLSTGVLVKGEAYDASFDALREDFLSLQASWFQTQARIKRSTNPHLISDKTNIIDRSMVQLYTLEIAIISIDSCLGAWKLYKRLQLFKNITSPLKVILRYYPRPGLFVTYFKLDLMIHSLLERRLHLNDGGSVVFEKTEALTSIDVNSGSFTQLKTSRGTVLWINCEAATEIANQLRLRNIGGIIVIDFIDMNYQKDQLSLLYYLDNEFRGDLGKPKIIQLSDIGLIELTRRRQGQSLYDVFSYQCASCDGNGYRKSLLLSSKAFRGLTYFETECNYFRSCDQNNAIQNLSAGM